MKKYSIEQILQESFLLDPLLKRDILGNLSSISLKERAHLEEMLNIYLENEIILIKDILRKNTHLLWDIKKVVSQEMNNARKEEENSEDRKTMIQLQDIEKELESLYS